jgi:protein phosphatase
MREPLPQEDFVGSAASSEAVTLTAFGLTDLGRVRKNNEDNFVIADLGSGSEGHAAWNGHAVGSQGALLLVADGMGGEAAGEVASAICAEAVPRRLHENVQAAREFSASELVPMLRETIEYSNHLVHQKSLEHEGSRGMGTTITAAALWGPAVFVAQVGDSRAYLARGPAFVQLTRDQTFLNYLADIGAIAPADIENDSRKSILTQAVGTNDHVDPKITWTQLARGDRILLCSDGLYNMVKDPELQRVVVGDGGLEEKCRTLIDLANQYGGADNITLIIAEVDGPGLPAPDALPDVAPNEYRSQDSTNGS